MKMEVNKVSYFILILFLFFQFFLVKYPGSAELLENSGVLSTETVKQIQKLAEDFAQTDAGKN